MEDRDDVLHTLIPCEKGDEIRHEMWQLHQHRSNNVFAVHPDVRPQADDSPGGRVMRLATEDGGAVGTYDEGCVGDERHVGDLGLTTLIHFVRSVD